MCLYEWLLLLTAYTYTLGAFITLGLHSVFVGGLVLALTLAIDALALYLSFTRGILPHTDNCYNLLGALTMAHFLGFCTWLFMTRGKTDWVRSLGLVGVAVGIFDLSVCLCLPQLIAAIICGLAELRDCDKEQRQ